MLRSICVLMAFATLFATSSAYYYYKQHGRHGLVEGPPPPGYPPLLPLRVTGRQYLIRFGNGVPQYISKDQLREHEQDPDLPFWGDKTIRYY